MQVSCGLRDGLGALALVAWAMLYSPGVSSVRADEEPPPAAITSPSAVPASAASPLPPPEATGPSCQAGSGPIREVRGVERELARELEVLRARAAAGRAAQQSSSSEVIPLDGGGVRYGAPPMHRAPPPPVARRAD